VDAREAARAVAGHYGLAGWGETTPETETAGGEVVHDEKPWWKFW
jgi:hypothetical protein